MSDAIKALERLSTTWYTGDMAEDWTVEGDIETIRTTLQSQAAQIAERDAAVRDMAVALEFYRDKKGLVEWPEFEDSNYKFYSDGSEALINEHFGKRARNALTTHKATIEAAK